MSFVNDGWNGFHNVPMAQMIDNTAYLGFTDYGLPLANYMDAQLDDFGTLAFPPPCLGPYSIEEYTNPHLYTLPEVTIPPTTAAADTPPAWEGSPGSSRELSPSSCSETNSECGGPKVRENKAVLGHVVTGGRHHAVRHAPYSISERPSIFSARITSPSTSTSWGYGISSTVHACRPAQDPAYMESPMQKIQDEFERLSTKLGKLGVKQVRHHPYLTCPVLDCKKGGLNGLLHGSNSTHPTTMPRRSVSPPLSPFTSTSTSPKPFFSFNELSRHVRSVHLAGEDLRCSHPGCDVQTKLDKKAGGKGRFSRVGVLRTHLKTFNDHRLHISEDVRAKYKLWKV